LIEFESAPGASAGPKDREKFARDFASRVNALVADENLARELGRAGRARVLAEFSWAAIAKRTAELYETIRPK
jgi:starch synthase